MPDFASRFGKFSRGGTPNPLWGGTQAANVAYQGLWEFSPKKHNFSSRIYKKKNFSGKCILLLIVFPFSVKFKTVFVEEGV